MTAEAITGLLLLVAAWAFGYAFGRYSAPVAASADAGWAKTSVRFSVSFHEGNLSLWVKSGDVEVARCVIRGGNVVETVGADVTAVEDP